MMRLGIFGGTFAPFHTGHRIALEHFLQLADLDRCLIVPSGTPPHKQKTSLFSDRQRLEMTRLACADLPNTEICDWEIRSDGPSYTYKTLEYVKESYPQAEPILFVGSDMLLTLQNWYRPQDIFDLAQIAAFSRTGEDTQRLLAHKAFLEETFCNARITVYQTPPFPVSSTEIREAWVRGESLGEAVCPAVSDYLNEIRLGQIRDLLHRRLSEKRRLHSEGVLTQATELALLHGADLHKTRLAALLHDMTKEFSEEEHFRLFEKYSYPLDGLLRTNRNLWHAHSASLDLTETLGITDPQIVSAVRYHTTGKEDMTPMEAILFTADAIDPTRDYGDVDFYRALAREDVYKAAYLIMEWTIRDLNARNVPCHGDMLRARDFLAAKYPDVTLESEQRRLNFSTKGT